MRRHRLTSLIFILCYIAIYKYVFCATFDGLNPITSINLKFPDAYINNEEQIELIRNTRGVASSRRHLRVGDAHQVANYFLTGGPQKGHAHFVRETKCERNDDESDTGSTNDNKNWDNTDLPENQNSSITKPDPIVGDPRVGAEPKHSDYNILDSILKPTIDSLSQMPHTLGNELLTSILHPNLHPHINALHKIPSNLMKTATEPVVSLMRARTELRKALQRSVRRKNSIYPPIVGLAPRSFQNNALPSNTMYPHILLSHPQPTGYILKYVPHNKSATPPSEVVSTQQSNCINDNLNTEENVENSINEDESIGEEQDGNDSE